MGGVEPSGTDGKTKEKTGARLCFTCRYIAIASLSGHEFITSFVWRVRVSFAIHYSCGPPHPWGMGMGREPEPRGKGYGESNKKKKILGRRT